ncbi:MAG: Ig-like domain-containing protein, partial [Gemmatimonadaceae bacterium]
MTGRRTIAPGGRGARAPRLLDGALRVATAALLAGAVVGAVACADRATGTGPPPTPALPGVAGVVVTDPVASPSGGLAYVSIAPDSTPAGRSVSIRNTRRGESVVAALGAGELDPLTIAADVDDVLAIEVRDGAGVIVGVSSVPVPRRRPPRVLRVDPPKGKTDVALNASVVVVFSEPVLIATPDAPAVLLLALGGGGTPVPVEASVLSTDGGLTVTIVPARPLAGSTTYAVLVTTGVRDLTGDPLEAPVQSEFTT